ncbi:ribonuclease E inhibitor RraB [Rhizobium sp.]
MGFFQSFLSKLSDAASSTSDNVDEFLKNEQVRRTLRENGDNGRLPRKVRHFAYFRSANARHQYHGLLVSRGYAIDEEHADGAYPNSWAIIFSRTQTPMKLDGETARLREATDQLDGEYDGWECEVIRS